MEYVLPLDSTCIFSTSRYIVNSMGLSWKIVGPLFDFRFLKHLLSDSVSLTSLLSLSKYVFHQTVFRHVCRYVLCTKLIWEDHESVHKTYALESLNFRISEIWMSLTNWYVYNVVWHVHTFNYHSPSPAS